MPQFRIEQIALAPRNIDFAKALLAKLGAEVWHEDTVQASGLVFGMPGKNTARLHFNYELSNDDKPLELELLHYEQGLNWLQHGGRVGSVCHLGMHCTAEELMEWFRFFAQHDITVAQEVYTQSHTNPAIAGTRWYKYVIFDTRNELGVDLKFIVRRDTPPVMELTEEVENVKDPFLFRQEYEGSFSVHEESRASGHGADQ